MDTKTIIAILASVVILIGWQLFFVPTQSVPLAPTTVTDTQNGSAAEMTTKPINAANTLMSQPTSKTKLDDLIISTDILDIAFNTATGNIRYASIKSWKDNDGGPITFNKGNNTYDYFQILTPVNSLPRVDKQKDGDTDIIRFTSTNNELEIIKEYRINNKNYMIDSSISVSNNSNVALNVPLTVTIGPKLGDGFEDSKYIFEGAMAYNKEDVLRVSYDDDDIVELSNPVWAGYTSKYFLFAIAGGEFNKSKIYPINGYEVASVEKSSLTVNPRDSYVERFKIYIGPKDYNGLKTYNLGLEESIDFGWFYFLAIPMLQLLLFIASIVKNYGLAIIVLTILVKIVTLPLTMKQLKSMSGMQKLQPEIAKLKDKYKGEPQKLNVATMDLYKQHKINPLSGCLPIIIQLPIFFALYKALLVSIELKGAPFIGYLVDLSAKDPYYITPIIMGISMFVQQLLTPSTADPMQKKIFLMMPIVFTFLFLNFPSGLVLYWLTNNLLSITQQLIINRTRSK